MAWGPDAAEQPSAYRAKVDDAFRVDAGGTSVAAPIWAAIIARLNEARRRAGRPRLGLAQPLLYRLATARPEVFRVIEHGTTDMTLPGVDARGRRVWFDLPGFRASRSWNPATGLGVPDVGSLEHAVVQP